MHQPIDAWLKLHEDAEIRDVAHRAVDDSSRWETLLDVIPGIGQELLEAEINSLSFPVVFKYHDFHDLTLLNHFRWMADTTPGQVRDMDEPIEATEINEGAKFNDIFDASPNYVAGF